MSSFTCFILIVYCTSQSLLSNVKLDKEHLAQYPYCGKLFGHRTPMPTSRVVNSRASELQYPWVVLVKRRYIVIEEDEIGITDDVEEFDQITECSGTVIGEK